jgi:RNA 2',3'-cyclic 3'-phosphodiesterase
LTRAPPEPTRRLFFALWPSDAERSALALAVAEAGRGSDWRTVPIENLHLTLAFLGSVPDRRLPELTRIARRCARTLAAYGPIAVTLTALEHWRRPQIIVATATNEPAAAHALAQALKDATVAAGFTPDLKPFRAHVTVARKVRGSPALTSLPAIEWRSNDFALLDSRSGERGPVYSVLESHLLGKREKSRE